VKPPIRIELGITNRCNSRCIICSHDPRWHEDMSIETVAAIVEAFPEVDTFIPQQFGEPMLHPRFVDIVRLLKARGKRVLFYTNGSLLAGDILDAMVEMLGPGDSVIFSVEGSTAEQYESIRKGLSFAAVSANIAAFQARKRGVKTEVRMTEVREFPADTAFWQSRVDEVWTVPEEPFGRSVKGHQETRYDSRTCGDPNGDMIVLPNGDVVLCCEDAAGREPLANIRDGIREAWGALERWRHEPHPMCAHCHVQWVNEEAL
jgi:MoaA/NifB/PqqE/SkfB family radical SAM enzyme